MTDSKKTAPESDTARSDPDTADRNRRELEKKAEQGLKDAKDQVSKDKR
jgi:hypothetical protein